MCTTCSSRLCVLCGHLVMMIIGCLVLPGCLVHGASGKAYPPVDICLPRTLLSLYIRHGLGTVSLLPLQHTTLFYCLWPRTFASISVHGGTCMGTLSRVVHNKTIHSLTQRVSHPHSLCINHVCTVSHQATTLSPGWIAWVFARNYLVMIVCYGGWHWVLFDSMYAAVMKTRKFDPKMPSVWMRD